MSIPQPNIIYRIQNVDFGTYLELWDPDEERVVLRPFKDTELQQWKFIKDTSGPGEKYKILAASTQEFSYPVHLGLPPAGDGATIRPPAAIMGDTGFSLWRIVKENDGSYAITTNGKDPRHEAFLRVTENGMLDTLENKISNSRSVNRSMRWEVVEFWPTVPKDTYRIRTLNGAALDISSSLDQFSVTAVRKDYRQEWEVEPKGNGKCLISMKATDKDKVYLGRERGKDGIAKIAPSKTPTEWIVKSLGDYTYSITFYYDVGDKDKTTLKLALSVTDSEVLLKPRKIAHNQIWFFENVDAFSGDNPPRYDAVNKRYDEIGQGLWNIYNVQSGQYAIFYGTSPQWIYGQSASKSNKTRIDYIDNGNTFHMAWESGQKYVRFAGSVVDVVDGPTNATAWALEREVDPSGGYVYYICPTFDRTQAISGETIAGLQGYQIFKVTTKKGSNRNQQWKFYSQ